MVREISGSVQGFILAGGMSRRMGSDKAYLTIDGETFLQRIATELAAVTDSVVVVGNRTDQTPPSLQTVADIYPNWGALGGVQTALANCNSDWAFVVACDFPFVSTQLFNYLLRERDDHEAVAPIQEDLVPQPLCSLYRVVPCLDWANKLINSGERKPIALYNP